MDMSKFCEKDGFDDYKSVSFLKGTLKKMYGFLFSKEYVTFDFDKEINDKCETEHRQYVVRAMNLKTFVKILLRPTYHVATTFVNGGWFLKKGELSDFIGFVRLKNKLTVLLINASYKIPSVLYYVKQAFLRKSVTSKSQENYNIDVEFYRTLLGPSMAYSCAFYDKQVKSLHEAQENKLRITMDRLEISNKDYKILDIGCGWGSMSFYLYNNTRSHITGISFAGNQITYCQDRIKTDNMDVARINFQKEDFRDFRNNESCIYDRIVSIGMIEHIGRYGYVEYFQKIFDLLKPDGIALIHSITDRRSWEQNQWINENISPAGIFQHSQN